MSLTCIHRVITSRRAKHCRFLFTHRIGGSTQAEEEESAQLVYQYYQLMHGWTYLKLIHGEGKVHGEGLHVLVDMLQVVHRDAHLPPPHVNTCIILYNILLYNSIRKLLELLENQNFAQSNLLFKEILHCTAHLSLFLSFFSLSLSSYFILLFLTLSTLH